MTGEATPQGRGSILGAVLFILLLGLGSAWWVQRQPAEAPEPAASPSRPRAAVAVQPVEENGIGWRTLHMPSPEDCLSVGSQDEDADFVASQGLSHEVLKEAMDAIVGEALRCVPDEDTLELSLEFTVRVGCNGVVDEVKAEDKGGASQRYIDCVANVLSYADFPGHDMPSGMEFRYPVNASF